MKAIVLFMFSVTSVAQSFFLPDTAQLNQTIEEYYQVKISHEIVTLQQTKKYRWLAYVPSPGYSPFMGGFTLSVNLAAPLQEVRTKHQLQQQQHNIVHTNQQAAKELKNQVIADWLSIQLDVEHYAQKYTLDSIRTQTYQLSKALYDRNEITPSEFLSSSQIYESWKVQRLAELLAIKNRINQIRLKAKMPVVSTDEHFVAYP